MGHHNSPKLRQAYIIWHTEKKEREELCAGEGDILYDADQHICGVDNYPTGTHMHIHPSFANGPYS